MHSIARVETVVACRDEAGYCEGKDLVYGLRSKNFSRAEVESIVGVNFVQE